MGDMLQSSSRVKLNRVALKDVIGVKIAPRRRKVQQPRADSKEEDKSVLEDSGCNKSPRDVLSYKKGAENGRASSIAAPGGKQEKRVDNNRTNSPGPAGLEGSMRRSNGCFDSVCQESKFSLRPQKNGSKRGLKRPSSDPVQGKAKSKKTTAKRSEERQLRTNPKVVLCDFAKNCSACRRGCGVILPKDLKNKAMRCFKQSGLQCWPGCVFHNKPEEQTCSAVLDGKNIRQVLNEEVGNRQMPLREATALLHSRLRNQVSTSAVASSSKHDSVGNRSTDTCSEGAGPVSDQTDSQAHKRINLGEISGFIRSRHPAAKGSNAALKLCKENGHQTELYGAQIPSEPICEKNHNDIPESFTCQRVNVYFRKAPYSCARTNIVWPFGKGHLSSHGPLASSSSKGVNFSVTDSVTEVTNQVGSSSSAALPETPLSKQEGGDGNAAVLSEGLTNSLHLHSNPTDDDDEDRTPSSLANGLETDSTCMTSSTLAFSPPSDASTHGDPNCLTSPLFLPFSTYLSEKAEDGLKADDTSMFRCEPSHLSTWGSPSSFTSENLDSSHSGESSLLFPQDKDQINNCPAGKPALNGNAVHLNSSSLCSFLKAGCIKADTNQYILPTLLSPVASPCRPAWRKSCERQSSSSSDEEEQAEDKQSSPECHRLQNQTEGHSSGNSTPGKARTSLWNVEDERDGKEDECDEDGQAVGATKEDASHSKTKSPALSPVQTKAPPCVGEEDPPTLDEITAYEHDILLVDVNQDDPDLFVDSPQLSLLRLGPVRASEAPKKTAPAAARLPFEVGGAPGKAVQSLTPVRRDLCFEGQDTAEGDSRPWRPRCSSTTPPSTQNACPTTDEHSRRVVQFDVNNNHADGVFKRMQPIQTVGSSLSIPAQHPWARNAAGAANFWRQKSNSYCRQYFSESLTCGFKMCRFQHLPVEGDEKFCVETVMRFIKNPACLQKAGAVFSGYYQSSPPGVYFSMQVFLSLLWALLKAGMVSDIFSILRVTLAHNIVPSHEFLLDLFDFVREKSLTGFVLELLQLTVKMVNVGLELSLDCVNHMPLFQQTIHAHPPAAATPHQKSSPSAPLPDCLSLAHAVIEVELCTKQEDWKRMGKVFCSVCQSSHHPNQVERISGRIAIALLSESKDKLSLPFAAFVETVFQNEGEGSLVKNFVGRIGVSLMLRYHKTHQWLKGRAVVEIMSVSKVSYTTTKGLFGNEDSASRCSLVTVATELFLLSGSVEGALNTLRENAWFLSSSSWPCDPPDLENRTRVLKHLAEKTSHRDTLEVLSNLPGIKDPSECPDISKYALLFNSHLQACVDRQILPVASDTVDFMLSKKLPVDYTLLQTLLHKLGKQNLWLRAREVFRHSLKAGHYPGVVAPPGFMTLVIPCGLGEVEQVLTLEMLITVNASHILRLPESSSSTLSITLTRTNSCESNYLSAGSRLLTAACIPQPKLTIHYTAVNSSQDQVFKLDVSSARRWLRHNHLWASEVWAQ
ncbi:testis- and ovary-specific PAZ domain-containing protein 1 isoform X2 [Oryzias latipes]|uniref:testis- and ovary-specific PAZ domain-containing protein 1 isoform X2 n=1 Tax=Oryzias latipes TaxID=8090 RepID=UPI000CE1925F|nr:testis- and ovary-specific PAZ domain-containing protein 1 isoform X2 [Oryzias latipes]